MIKRIVIAGCRDYNNYEEAKEYIDFCISEIQKKYTLIFLSGGCNGADILGEQYAKENGFKIERHPAKREKYGRAAGPLRNKKWLKYAIMQFAFGMVKAKAPNR